MKKIKSALILLLIVISVSVNAQYGKNRHNNYKEGKEKIESMKIAFLTEKLNLTPLEAQKFWPVYNKYDDIRRTEFRRESFIKKLDDDSISKLSENQASALVDSIHDHCQRMFDIDKMYQDDLKKVLPQKKILLLFKYDKEFKRHLLEKVRDNRKMKKNRE